MSRFMGIAFKIHDGKKKNFTVESANLPYE